MKFEGTQAYVATDDLKLAVNAAITLERPLLVKGEPGTGKTMLAEQLAESFGARLITWHIKSTTKAHQGLYEYDAVSRLRDSQLGVDKVHDVRNYLKKGKLWEAFESEERVILLIDEIDKADIDLPNDLLNVLEEGRFHIPELSRLGSRPYQVFTRDGLNQATITGGRVECYEYPLVVMTSNGERDFPAAFLRRCLQLRMPDPSESVARLAAIVTAHLGETAARDADELIRQFMVRAQEGEILATDQLLNAIQLVMGAYSMNEADRKALTQQLTSSLGRKP